ncbi:MAG: 3-hydroxyacyl-CoA dehydrogenase NAD-binding domain-containing protein, partial [Chloroflexota bacterium]
MATSPRDIHRATVTGAGAMGSGIAQVLASAGIEVTLVDVAPRQLEQAQATIEGSLDRRVHKGTLSAEQRDGALARIRPTRQLDASAGADLLIEA